MKIFKQKIKFIVLILSLLLVAIIPFYMYFGHDVEQLNRLYPHLKDPKSLEAEYELKKARPKSWVGLKEISSYGKWAIIFSEDWSFYQHEGVDLEQIKVAVNEMVEESRFRGASTITQQMVKTVFLYQDRTLWRKLNDIILAYKAEKYLSKSKILEVYLNTIEFGPRIYGIKLASYHYFGKHPSALNPRESAFLAMLLPSPKRYYISFKRKKLTIFAQKRIKEILIKMRMGKVLTPEQCQQEIESELFWEK